MTKQSTDENDVRIDFSNAPFTPSVVIVNALETLLSYRDVVPQHLVAVGCADKPEFLKAWAWYTLQFDAWLSCFDGYFPEARLTQDAITEVAGARGFPPVRVPSTAGDIMWTRIHLYQGGLSSLSLHIKPLPPIQRRIDFLHMGNAIGLGTHILEDANPLFHEGGLILIEEATNAPGISWLLRNGWRLSPGSTFEDPLLLMEKL